MVAFNVTFATLNTTWSAKLNLEERKEKRQAVSDVSDELITVISDDAFLDIRKYHAILKNLSNYFFVRIYYACLCATFYFN